MGLKKGLHFLINFLRVLLDSIMLHVQLLDLNFIFGLCYFMLIFVRNPGFFEHFPNLSQFLLLSKNHGFPFFLVVLYHFFCEKGVLCFNCNTFHQVNLCVHLHVIFVGFCGRLQLLNQKGFYLIVQHNAFFKHGHYLLIVQRNTLDNFLQLFNTIILFIVVSIVVIVTTSIH